MLLSVGKAPTPEAPRTIDGRYWKWLMRSSLLYGDGTTGPLGFGPTPRPLAASQTSDLRRGVASAPTGYEPTGIRPTSSHARLRREMCTPGDSCARIEAALLWLRLFRFFFLFFFFFFFLSFLQVLPFAFGRAKTASASSPESADSRKQPSFVTFTPTGAVP